MGVRYVQVLVGKMEGNRLLVKLRRRGGDNNNMVLQRVELGCGLKLFSSGQGQVLCSSDCDKGNSGSIKRWEFLDQLTAC